MLSCICCESVTTYTNLSFATKEIWFNCKKLGYRPELSSTSNCKQESE